MYIIMFCALDIEQPLTVLITRDEEDLSRLSLCFTWCLGNGLDAYSDGNGDMIDVVSIHMEIPS